MRIRFGLEGKFIVLASLVILVSTAIGNRLILAYEEGQLVQQLERETQTVAESMAHAITYTLIYEELGLVQESGLLDLFVEYIASRENMDVLYVEVLDTSDRIVAHSQYRNIGRIDPDFRQRHTPDRLATDTIIADIDGETLLEVAAPLGVASKSWGTLVIGVSLRPVESELNVFGFRLGLLTLTAIAGSVLLALLVARALARPIKQLATAMTQVGPGLESPVRADRGDEIGLLQSSFLEMLQRLRTAQSEQERTREAMVGAEKLASIGSLAAGVAHEINNPLAGIRNCLGQLQPPGDSRRLERYLPLMAQAVERIEQVVRGLLDFSRRRELDVGLVDVPSMARTTLSLVDYRLEKSGVELDLDLPADLPRITGDQHQLQQILLNLVLNALDAMPDGGRLRIGARCEPDSVFVEVGDTGAGVIPSQADRLFDPFFTTKEVGKGTGLGLTVSLSIAREHGGDLSHVEADGETVFKLTLPLASASTIPVGKEELTR